MSDLKSGGVVEVMTTQHYVVQRKNSPPGRHHHTFKKGECYTFVGSYVNYPGTKRKYTVCELLSPSGDIVIWTMLLAAANTRAVTHRASVPSDAV